MTKPQEHLTPTAPKRNGDTLSMLMIGAIIFGGYFLYDAFEAVMKVLKIIADSGLVERMGLPKSQTLKALMGCWNDVPCKAWTVNTFWTLFPKWHLMLLALIPVPAIITFITQKKTEAKYEQKAPGGARWASIQDVEHLSPDQDQVDHGNPHTGYLGNLLEFKPGKKHATVHPLVVPLNEWCQNILVQGGVGSGKTTGFFQNYGMMAAHLGHTIVVIDTKWPQRDSGFRELLGYWQALGRKVVLYTPFEENSIQIDIAGNLTTFDAGLRYADTVMPPPEFREEPGEHFKKLERRVLAAMAILNTRSGGTQRELLLQAMKPMDDLKKWVDSIPDPMLSSIMKGATSRGDKDFADSMTGIISALRVFFNDKVAQATSPGAPEHTVDLQACFKEPTLIYAAFNQQDLLDGSGTILMRMLLRSLTEAIFSVAKNTPTGKLPHPATIMMDEQPSYGRMNYLMRLTGTMRSYNLSILFGIQDSAQSKLVYGDDYWTAISENVISRRIAFPRGLTGKDAEDISRRCGMTSNIGVSVGVTAGTGGEEDRYSATTRLEKQPLLPVEEFNTFGIGEGVVMSSQHPPIRALFVPITFPTIRSKHVKPGTPNWLHQTFFKDMMTRIPKGMSLGDYTDMIIKQGKFRTLPKSLRAYHEELAPGIHKPVGEEVPERFVEWISHALALDVDVRHIPSPREQDPGWQLLRTAVDAHPLLASMTEMFQNAMYIKLLDTGMHYKVLTRGWALLNDTQREDFVLASYRTPITSFIQQYAQVIDNHPEREAIPENEREEAIGEINDGVLKLRLKFLSVIYKGQTQPKFKRERVGKADMVVIPYGDRQLMKEIVENGYAPAPAANPEQETEATNIQSPPPASKKPFARAKA